MAFIEPMYRNKPIITYFLTSLCLNEKSLVIAMTSLAARTRISFAADVSKSIPTDFMDVKYVYVEHSKSVGARQGATLNRYFF